MSERDISKTVDKIIYFILCAIAALSFGAILGMAFLGERII